MIRVVLTAAITLLAACSFGEDFGGTRYQCGAGGRCPPGQTCVGGFCVAAAPDASPGDCDGGCPQPVCGSIALLSDTFDDATPGPNFFSWTEGGITVSENAGHLVIALAAGTGTGFGGYTSPFFYDLTDSAIETEVGEIGGHNTLLEVRTVDDDVAQVAYEDGLIAATVFNVPGGGTRREIAYDPAQVYWRIRVAAGTMFWETSANRTAWNLLHSEAAPFDVRHVRGVLSAGGQLAAPSTARFDDVNPVVPSGLRYCPLNQLTDDFAAGPFNPTFESYQNPGCTITETGGKATMSFPGTGSVFCGLVARHLWDLSLGEIVIDSNDLPIRTNFVSYLQAVSPANNETRVEASLDSGTWFGVNRVNGVDGPMASMPYDRAMHRYWRMKGVGAQIEIATSPDATAWTVRFTASPPFDTAKVIINFGAGHYNNVNPAGTVIAQLPGVNAP